MLRRLITGLSTPRYVLGVGYAAMLSFMLLLTLVGVVKLADSQQRLEQIVNGNVAKITLSNRMYAAARERTVSLQRLILLRDPFERDEQWMNYLAQATEFVSARQAMLALKLTDEEQQVLQRQAGMTNEAVPVQEQVMKLIWAGQTAEAHRVLVNVAIPLQDRVLVELKRLYQMQEQQAVRAAERATRDYRRAQLWLWVLAVGTFAVALFIAYAVLRQARRADQALREEKERAQVTLHSLGEAVVRTNAQSVIEYLNPTAERLTGWSQREAQGRDLQEILNLVHDTTRMPVANPVTVAMSVRRVVTDTDDIVLVTRNREERAVELTVAPVRDGDDQVSGAVLVFRDVTEMRALSREIAYQATHDPLTGLVNRREFERLLSVALDDVRHGDVIYALCYLDLDLFKAVNDTCGHLAGDELLRQVSLLLRKAVRREDVLARIGGDEFVVLLRGCGLEKASEIAEQIRRSLKDFRFVWEDKRLEVGASIGVARVAADGGGLNEVLRDADVACRVAKEAGRNRLHVFHPNDLTVTRRQREINWVKRLGQAVSEDEFQLYGQWVVPLAAASGKVPHCEVLIRLRDEAGHPVLPAAFLPAAERYHLMPTIDRWVVHNTLQLLRTLCPGRATACFHINLSGQTLCDPEFLSFVQRELAETGVPPGCVGFEITETAAVTNMSSAMRLIGALKKIGCRFALDDFGSGVSSFYYLKSMPVDYLKIDGSFVSNLPDDAIDLAMVNSVNQVAHVMGIQTIAEYVENDAIQATLASLGVDYGQGYALARPALLADIVRELEIARTPGLAARSFAATPLS